MKDFSTADDQPAPAHTDKRDLAFFAEHPDREYRARAPFPHELDAAQERGHSLDLAPGQSWVVIVMRCGATLITTTLLKARLDTPGSYPNSDDEIRGAFKGPRPVTPAGAAA